MEEQYQDLLNGFVILVLIINTLAISTLISERTQDNSLSPSITTTGASLETNNPNMSAVLPVSTIATPVKTKAPTPAPTPIPARKDYVNIFYMQNKELDTSMPPVFLNLLNPPLIIDFDVTPMNTTDLIPYDYKLLSTEHHDLINITKPYENARFLITVTENNTGIVVAEKGSGGKYAFESPQSMMIMERGNYTISISGMYITKATVSMQVPKEGNFPK
jgi:hypothetical protein